ncbi:hypothetical protein [Micromonospora sp. C95]|uniref:hypothetical protein n=1 Tax=Micromonospora sp. C95 TaxID=2824882 RepID=UPI001B389CA9|nr:hypothetical protein [Micromonospora sp. C95]MBQ1027171.1 hypothetical protein [Micromonospora sp. C95]
MLVSTIAGVVGATAGVMQWLTSAGAWAVVAVGVVGLAAAAWALAWLWRQQRAVPATVVVMLLVAIAAITGAATDRIVGRPSTQSTAGDSAASTGGEPDIAAATSSLPSQPSRTPTPASTPTPTSTPTPSPSTSASGEDEPASTGGELEPTRTAKGVELSSSYALDLDSVAENWNVERTNLSRGRDVMLSYGVLRTTADVVVVDGEPEHAKCENAVTRQRNIGGEQLRAGQSFCVHTSEKRWAWITLRRYAPSESITFDVTVW